jgi:hypothetical protein
MRDGGQILQGQVGVEVVLDIRDDGPELALPEPAVWIACRPARRRDVSDQGDGQDVGQRLGGELPPGVVGPQLGIHRLHRGPELSRTKGGRTI